MVQATSKDHSSKPEAEALKHGAVDDSLSEIVSKKRQELFEKVKKMGRALGRAHAEMESHKYWYFRPGYEVDTAF
jgi:hypothetical protein